MPGKKKNKGGRPRNSARIGNKPGGWQRITNPKSTNHYEINPQGLVRRKSKRTEEYFPVKPWVTGGPYAAVYLYGVKGATRGRKKVYVHRLVADHFVPGKSKAKVVHHIRGAYNNSAKYLEWVSVEDNLKARKYFNNDGTRRVRKWKKKTKVSQGPEPAAKTAEEDRGVLDDQAPIVDEPDLEDWEPGEYREESEWSFSKKFATIQTKSPSFRREWKDFRKKVPGVTVDNFRARFRQIVKKGLPELEGGYYTWLVHLRSALYEMRRRQQVA